MESADIVRTEPSRGMVMPDPAGNLTRAESRYISAMRLTAKKMEESEEAYAVLAMQNIAIHLAKYDAVMTMEGIADLILAGAALEKLALNEMKAQISAAMLLSKIGKKG